MLQFATTDKVGTDEHAFSGAHLLVLCRGAPEIIDLCAYIGKNAIKSVVLIKAEVSNWLARRSKLNAQRTGRKIRRMMRIIPRRPQCRSARYSPRSAGGLPNRCE
jgi:hypothetical protein